MVELAYMPLPYEKAREQQSNHFVPKGGWQAMPAPAQRLLVQFSYDLLCSSGNKKTGPRI